MFERMIGAAGASGGMWLVTLSKSPLEHEACTPSEESVESRRLPPPPVRRYLYHHNARSG